MLYSSGGPPNRLITLIIEFAIGIAVSGYLIRLGTCYIQQSLPMLIVIALLVGAAVIAWRIWKHCHDTKW